MEQSVYEMYKDKASLARDAADRRCAQVWAMDERIKEIDTELSKTGMSIFAAALSDDSQREARYKKLESHIAALRQEKRERLKSLGFPEDYTEVKYECEKCSDTGYVGFKMCDCMKKALIRLNYAKSGIGKYLEKQSFDNFNLTLYPFGEARTEMQNIFTKLRQYADSFSSDSTESLLLMGSTGLGKTHLSSAVAKRVLEKGHSVCYDSAQNIISCFERERFLKQDEKSDGRKYFDCDLLIIDDLGAEIQSKTSVSYFYTLINTRLLASKPTIVSTNLSAKELTKQYEQRIVSRLFGEYTVYVFQGEDIRKVKRL